jgi:hypothetical protein
MEKLEESNSEISQLVNEIEDNEVTPPSTPPPSPPPGDNNGATSLSHKY